MASYFPYGVWIDRALETFDVTYSYNIPGYTDPETGEYFGDTNWTTSIYDAESGALLGGNSGTGSESGDAVANLGIVTGGDLRQFRIDYWGQNWFSAVGFSISLNVFSAAGATVEQLINGTDDSDVLAGGSADDVILGKGGQDYIDGGEGNDILSGGDGDDTLLGLDGDDTMVGGAGGDTYHVSQPGDTAVESLDGGEDLVVSGIDHTLAANVEGLKLMGLAIAGKGNDLDNAIDGNEQANTLSGEGGNDLLRGFGGRDLLIGGKGSDRLEGGQDADVMRGGQGNDTYVVEHVGDRVVERQGEGIDTVEVYALDAYRLTAEVENVVRMPTFFNGESGPVKLTGNALANRMVGGTGGDTILGGFGNDRLFGMDGLDKLDGGFDNDFIRGGRGNDSQTGGAGSDIFSFSRLDGYDVVWDFQPGDKLQIDAGEDYDTFAEVMASASQIPAGTILSLGVSLTVQLMGVTLAALDADDFIFV